MLKLLCIHKARCRARKCCCRARKCHCAPSRNLFCLRLFHSRLFVVVSLSGWLEEIQNKSSPIVRRLFDCYEQWKCFFSSRSTGFDLFDFEIFSAVQRIPPRAARGRPLGTYLHITNIVATWWEQHQHQHQHLQHQCNETKDRDLQDQNADYVWWSSYLFAKRFPNCWQQCGQTSCGAEIRRQPNATTVRGCPVRCHLSIFVRCPVRYIVPISDQRSLFFCDNWSPRLTSHGSRGTPTTTSEFSCPVSCEYWIVLLPVASTLMEYYESDRGGRRGETC